MRIRGGGNGVEGGRVRRWLRLVGSQVLPHGARVWVRYTHAHEVQAGYKGQQQTYTQLLPVCTETMSRRKAVVWRLPAVGPDRVCDR